VGEVEESRVIPQEPVSHIHLTTLNLSHFRYRHVSSRSTKWKFVRLPKLKHLNIRVHGSPSMTPSRNRGALNVSYAPRETTFDALLDMLFSSGCSLQTATIHNIFGDYRRTSRGFLRVLDFTDPIVDDFIAKLPVSATGQRILTTAKAGVLDGHFLR
jgi:hypothetical protein